MFSDRLLDAIKLRNKTRGWLAQQIGTSEAAINMLVGGKSKSMNAANTAKAAKALQVSCLWLATGEGPMEEMDHPVWRDVARNLATTLDAAEGGQRFAQFVLKVDEIIEAAQLHAKAARAPISTH